MPAKAEGIFIDTDRGCLLTSICISPKDKVTVWPRLMSMHPGRYAALKKGEVVIIYPAATVSEALAQILKEIASHGSSGSSEHQDPK